MLAQALHAEGHGDPGEGQAQGPFRAAEMITHLKYRIERTDGIKRSPSSGIPFRGRREVESIQRQISTLILLSGRQDANVRQGDPLALQSVVSPGRHGVGLHNYHNAECTFPRDIRLPRLKTCLYLWKLVLRGELFKKLSSGSAGSADLVVNRLH